MKILLPLLVFSAIVSVQTHAAEFNLANYSPQENAESALKRCFEDVANAGGGTVTIPAGDYFVSGGAPIPLSSHTSVFAHGARFHLPDTLGDKARIVLFEGTNVQDFSWTGGHFSGHCFDHRRQPNTWEPNANTRILVFKTSPKAKSGHLTFRDITSERVAGAIIHVEGVPKARSESEVETFATDITVENCSLLDSGKFMWDYGLLWQILVWPEEYQPADVAMAQRYFRNEVIREGVRMESGDDRVFVQNTLRPIPVGAPPKSASDAARQALCFYGDQLPSNIVRGKRYYAVESSGEFIKVSETIGGKPIQFSGSAGPACKLMSNLQAAFFELYAPTGAGPGKGAVDIVCAKNVRISGCKLSALGDTMHIQRSEDIVFANNQIVGSRMGAFFLAEYCKNALVTGNIVDGTNGSRVISLEKSSENVVLMGNTFRNGGRGSWINQPRNLILQGNIFVNNTTKCIPDPWQGRKTFKTGTWESYPEMYFTLHQPKGEYGPVILKDNLFVLGEHGDAEGVTFAPNGHDIQMTGNVFQKRSTQIVLDPGCQKMNVRDNPGADVLVRKPTSQSGNW